MHAFRQATSRIAPRALDKALLSTTTRLPSTAAIRTLIATSTTQTNPGLHKLYGTRCVGGDISNHLNRKLETVRLPEKMDKEGSTYQHRATASTCRALNTTATKGVDSEVSNYLNRNVEAVALPKKQGQDKTYPPLILDGASGTGKTQQAFALAKKHENIIYFLLSEPPQGFFVNEQKIYQRMRSLTTDMDVFRFAHRVDETIKTLRANENNKDKDICALKYLLEKIGMAKKMPIDFNPDNQLWDRKDVPSAVPWMGQLMDVVLWMCSQRLQYVNGGLDVVPIQLGDNTNVKFEDLYSQLKDIILFVDEALPMGAGEHPDSGALNRLRFVRNLGRALTMKVVIAGTAATAANMIAEPATSKPVTSKPASRADIGSGELAWIECQFLWKPMLEDGVKKVFPNLASSAWDQALISALARGRPHLVHLISRVVNESFEGHVNSENLPAVLEKVGLVLQLEKQMSHASNLVYLTAVWLHLVHITPSGFRLKPPDLVRGHYFEPCVVVDKQKNIACGLPWEERSVASGHLRVKIFCQMASKAKKAMWKVSMTDTNGKLEPRAGFCWDFSGVEYALTACVQQCLAREPLLAVAISTQCSMNSDMFRNALPMLYQETPQQLNVDAADGELNEHILFALLQLASNSPQGLTEPRVNLDVFLKKIAEYLRNDSGELFADGVLEFCVKLENYEEPELSQVRLDELLGKGKLSKEFTIDDQTKENFKTCSMPWLVPACSYEALKETVDGAPSLFDGTEIAGLVPGVRNATFDAAAYSWKKMSAPEDVLVLPEWVFEFKTRSQPGYSINGALNDLKEKCLSEQKKLVNEQENQEGLSASEQPDERESHEIKKRKQRVSDKPDGLKCHAMIIATTGGRSNFCKIVYSDDTRKYLRVAVVVGNGR